jgi:dolichol kinase
LNGNSLEAPRRLFHLSGLLLLLVPYFWGEEARFIFLGAALLISALEFWRLTSPGGRRFLEKVFRPLMRPHEGSRPSGTFFYFWGLALSFNLFGNRCASIALAVLAVADPLAAVAGNLRSRPRLLRKTLCGTMVFWGTATLLFMAGGFAWQKAFLLGGLSALLENLSPLDDNLVLPVGVGFLCHLL